nr:E3 ubiquitin/ISG15 ligase TRIM25-like isoform X5 [Pseudochaenichthys georgianus]
MSSMQVCYCGWSKVTTYQGLRTHQGKMGCTPRGMSIPESDQFRFTRCTFANIGPSIQIEEPLKDIFGPYLEIDHQQFAWRNALEETLQNDSGRNNGITPVWEIPQTSDENLLLTTYQGLRTHQGMMGRTQRGYSIPQSDQLRLTSSLHGAANVGPFTFEPLKFESKQITWRSPLKESPQQDDGPNNFIASARGKNVPVASNFTTLTAAPAAEATLNDINQLFATAQQNSQQTATNSDTTHQGRNFSSGAQPSLLPMPQMFGTPTIPAAAEVPVMKTQQSSLQNATNSDQTHQAFNPSSGAQASLMPMSQIFGSPTFPTVKDVTVTHTNKSMFETPPHLSTTHQNTNNVRRALDFSTGAQQVGQLDWELPTTTAQETAIQLKEREREREREMEKEREAQQLQKMRQDMIRADLHQKIQTREQKISEVTSSVKACKGGLDAEWLEINSVFSEVMKVVEDSRKKALQPLEERRQRVSRAGKDQVKKLQNEIDKIRKTIDELDKNADLQGLPKTGLDESRDWKHLTVDTSFSFGSLRATTSSMMEQIHQQLEKLSSVELKRIPTFAVDVKLNPTTAHQCLVLSPDGKTVRDGGNYQKVPDAPQRFDMFGSILGLNRLTSGKSYWEVEVTKKSGWDLGVARRNANRKGKLSVNSDNGYWVVVHYKDKKYAALTVPPVSLPLKEKPEKVGVFVDYEERLVSFYDVMAQSHIYTFTECMFSDVILPYFSPHPKQNEKNSHPLIISPVKKQL